MGILILITGNCVRTMEPNNSTLAPCSVLSQSYAWDFNSSCYSGSSESERINKWVTQSYESRLTSCCKLFRSIFNYGNIEDIFQIMKFSLGQQMPKSLSQIQQMKPQEHSGLFPNNGNFTAMKIMGFVTELFIVYFRLR